MLRLLAIYILFSTVSAWSLFSQQHPDTMEWTSFPVTTPNCSVIGRWQHPRMPNHTLVVRTDPDAEDLLDHRRLYFEYHGERFLSGDSEVLPEGQNYALHLRPRQVNESGTHIIASCHDDRLWAVFIPHRGPDPITSVKMTPVVEEKPSSLVTLSGANQTVLSINMNVSIEALQTLGTEGKPIQLRPTDILINQIVAGDQDSVDARVKDSDSCLITVQGHHKDLTIANIRKLLKVPRWDIWEQEPQEATEFHGSVICPNLQPFWLVKMVEVQQPSHQVIDENDICLVGVPGQHTEVTMGNLKKMVQLPYWDVREHEPEEPTIFKGKATCSNMEPFWVVKFPERPAIQETDSCRLTVQGDNKDLSIGNIKELLQKPRWELREHEPEEPTDFQGMVTCPDMVSFWLVKVVEKQEPSPPVIQETDICRVTVRGHNKDLSVGTIKELLQKPRWEMREHETEEPTDFQGMVTCPNMVSFWLVKVVEEEEPSHPVIQETDICRVTVRGHNKDLSVGTIKELLQKPGWEMREQETEEPTDFQGMVTCPNMVSFWLVKAHLP